MIYLPTSNFLSNVLRHLTLFINIKSCSFFQHAFEDPEGRVELPSVIQSSVEYWKRPIDFIEDKVSNVVYLWIRKIVGNKHYLLYFVS